MTPRRFHTATAILGAAHHSFELGAGTGLIFQPELGLPGAAAVWGAWFPAWVAAARLGSGRWDRALAFGAGMSLGAVVLHFRLWPWRRVGPLPWLTEAEGLNRAQLPPYNALLHAWGAAAALALAVETPRRWRWALAGFGIAQLFRGRARHHFEWVREQAAARPAWWNRALRATS